MACAKRGPYEADGSLHNRVLRPPEVIVWEQPASGVVKHYGETPKAALSTRTQGLSTPQHSAWQVLAPLRMTSQSQLTIGGTAVGWFDYRVGRILAAAGFCV